MNPIKLVCAAFTIAALLPFSALSDDADKAMIAKLAQKIEALEAEMATLRRAGSGSGVSTTSASSTPQNVTARTSTSDPIGSNRTPVKEKTVEKTVEAALIKQNAILLQPGNYELEPGISYTHSSSDSVVINGFSIFPVLVVGSVTSEEIRRDTLVGSLTGRAGLPYGMQVDVRVPYQYIEQERTQANGTHTALDTSGLGDVSLGLSKELLTQQEAWPNLIGRVSWKFDSGESIYDGDPLGIGSGFQSARAELTALKITDPAAIYASFGYVTNLEDTKSGARRIDIGDSFEASFGTTVALNQEFAMSLGVQNAWTLESTLNGNTVNGSSLNVGNLSLGFSYELLEQRRLDISTSAGLTRDAPDYTLSLSMPFRF